MNAYDIEKIAKDLTDQAALVSHQYGPQAWSIVCNVKRVDSIGYLSAGILSLIGAGILAYIFHSTWKDEEKRDEEGWQQLMFLEAMGGCMLLVVGLGMDADVWNWVGVIDPGLAISHDVITKVLAH
jgi:hypothetical protein